MGTGGSKSTTGGRPIRDHRAFRLEFTREKRSKHFAVMEIGEKRGGGVRFFAGYRNGGGEIASGHNTRICQSLRVGRLNRAS